MKDVQDENINQSIEEGASEYGNAMRGNSIESKFKHPVVKVEKRPSSNALMRQS